MILHGPELCFRFVGRGNTLNGQRTLRVMRGGVVR